MKTGNRWSLAILCSGSTYFSNLRILSQTQSLPNPRKYGTLGDRGPDSGSRETEIGSSDREIAKHTAMAMPRHDRHFCEPGMRLMPKKQSGSSREILIATCGCILLLVCWGLAYSMPVMFPSLADRFSVPVWHFAAFFSIGGAIYFSVGSPAGAVADRYGTPIVVAVGSVISASGFLLASFAKSEIVFAIGYIIGIGAGIGSVYAPVTAAVQVLATNRKIVAAGITSAGIGFGSMLLPPMVSWLNHIANWQVTLQAMSAFAIVGILPVFALRGVVQKAPPPTGVSALRTNTRFAWAFAGQVLFAVMFFVPFAHLVNISLWHGWTTFEGVELISLLGLGSTAGRFVVTPFAQRAGACRTASLCAYVTAAAMVGIALASAHWVIWGSVAIFGLTYGGVIALSAPIVSEICGAVNIGKNVGTLMGARAVGVLVGPWSVGVAEWWLNSYTGPLLACAFVGVASAVCMERSGSQVRVAIALA
jgi:OFA family oxalate/formate antiporter-like MFS transporter